jgi:hypothetical protein
MVTIPHRPVEILYVCDVERMGPVPEPLEQRHDTNLLVMGD